tara:strand:- start:1188 stop:1370 length:183 start_codon:yes stop_codon:yes gene_type:complete
MEILKNIVNSKKFWYAFGMFIFINCSSVFGISEGEMANLIYVGIALIVAQGISDFKSCGK